MQVEIITIGDELLIGQVVDTNSAWMGQQLNKAGFSVNRITSVSDQEQEILNILDEATHRVPIVLITGGLGPTRDDITKTTLCKFFNTRLVFNAEVLTNIENLLKGRVTVINQLNHDQALVPENCTVISNPVGTAPIMWFNYREGVVVSMPGVPYEMKYAMEAEVIPRLTQQFRTGVILHKTVHILNIPESVLAEMLSKWEDQLPSFLRVAYLPSPGRVRLRLTGKNSLREPVEKAVNEAVEALFPLVGDNIYGFDDELPEEALLKLLLIRNQTVSFAESCSGGFLSHRLTALSGASQVFKGSAVAYANEVKMRLLGVSPVNMEAYGAVSQQVVEEMALGACKLFETDYSVAISGIAGPTGGSNEKPVGTVWIAWAGNGKVISRKYLFGNSRERTILRSAETGLIELKLLIERGEL